MDVTSTNDAEGRALPQPAALIALNPYEARTAAAIFERLFPADEHGPGAMETGVVTYLDRALAGAYRDRAETYRVGLATLDQIARQRHATPFADCGAEQQAPLWRMGTGRAPRLPACRKARVLEMLRAHLQEGLFAEPAMGQPRQGGLAVPGHPGFCSRISAEENLAAEPATKGVYHSVAAM